MSKPTREATAEEMAIINDLAHYVSSFMAAAAPNIPSFYVGAALAALSVVALRHAGLKDADIRVNFERVLLNVASTDEPQVH